MWLHLPQDFAIEDVLSEYDLDKDGFISLSEFIGDLRANGMTTFGLITLLNITFNQFIKLLAFFVEFNRENKYAQLTSDQY